MQAGIFCLLWAFCSHVFSWEVESDPEPAPVPEARVIKKILPLSEEERANEAYMKAKQLLHSGPSGSAENALKRILKKTYFHLFKMNKKIFFKQIQMSSHKSTLMIIVLLLIVNFSNASQKLGVSNFIRK